MRGSLRKQQSDLEISKVIRKIIDEEYLAYSAAQAEKRKSGASNPNLKQHKNRDAKGKK